MQQKRRRSKPRNQDHDDIESQNNSMALMLNQQSSKGSGVFGIPNLEGTRRTGSFKSSPKKLSPSPSKSSTV